MSPSTKSLELAAQAWCDPEAADIEMDSRLAYAFARILDRVALPVTDGVWALLEKAAERLVKCRVGDAPQFSSQVDDDVFEILSAALSLRTAPPAMLRHKPGNIDAALRYFKSTEGEPTVDWMNGLLLAQTVEDYRALSAPPLPESPWKARDWDEDEIKDAPDGWYAVRLHEDDYVDGMLVSENDWMEAMVKAEAIRAAEFPSFQSAYGPLPAAPESPKGGEA